LDADAMRGVEAHLSACAACRLEADARQRDHRQLAAAFSAGRASSQRLAEQVVVQLDAMRQPSSSGNLAVGKAASFSVPFPRAASISGLRESETLSETTTSSLEPGKAGSFAYVISPTWRIAQLLLAVAAGFLIAVLVLRPWDRPAPVVDNSQDSPAPPFDVTPASFARMDVAIGSVDYAPAASRNFLTCPSNTSLASGAVVRTAASARCELNVEESIRLRLNEHTQMKLADERRVELTAGELWLEVEHAEPPFRVEVEGLEIDASQATLNCSARPPRVELLVLEGKASVKAAAWTRDVAAGEKLSVVDGQPTQTTPFIDPIVETRWVHDILIQKGPDDAELNERIDRLWAQVGRAKMAHLYEEEIRSLGGHCATPLTCYIQSPESQQEPERRVSAARLLADIAPPESIPQLIALLSDTSGDVRFYAAEALQRLTGQNFGRPPEAWQAESWGACQATAAQWKSWWDTAKERYPGAKQSTELLAPRTNLQKKS
jgi:hypothetical protein